MNAVVANHARSSTQSLEQLTAAEARELAPDLPPGSMGPKVEAAVDFARTTGKEAVIGALNDLSHILNGTAGTRVSMTMTGIAYG